MEKQVPVVFTLEVDSDNRRHLLVNRYLGQSVLPPQMPIAIEPGRGIVPLAVPQAVPDLARPLPPPPSLPPIMQKSIKYSAAFRT